MKHYFIPVFLLLISLSVYAQNPSSPSIKVNKPFDPDETIGRSNVYHEQYCLKFHSFLLMRGVFCMSLEKMISEKFSVDFGGGVAYRDWIFEDMNDLKLTGFMDDDKLNIKYGPVVNLSARYYFYDGELDGFYISLMLRYRGYHIKTVPYDPTYASQNVDYNMTEGGFFIGTQIMDGIGDVSIDVYFGPGFSQKNYFKAVDTYGNPKFTKMNVTDPYVYLGVNIGLPF